MKLLNNHRPGMSLTVMIALGFVAAVAVVFVIGIIVFMVKS